MKEVLYLVLFLIFASLASCTSTSKVNSEHMSLENANFEENIEQAPLQRSSIDKDYKVYKAIHAGTSITTNIITHKEDILSPGDTVIAVYNEGELQLRYELVDIPDEAKSLRKVIITK